MADLIETDEDSGPESDLLPPSLSPDDPPRVPSAYALRFGEATVNPAKGLRKSGLTPIEPLRPGELLSPRSWRRYEWSVAYQYDNMLGFISWELKDCGALIKEDAIANNLDVEDSDLHPLFQRARWRQGIIPLPLPPGKLARGNAKDEADGVWDARDKKAWQVVLPTLRLATKLLSHPHVLHWFDAMAFGNMTSTDIGQGKVPNYTIHPRDVKTAARDRHQVEERLVSMARKNHFQFGSGEGNVGFHGKTKVNFSAKWREGEDVNDRLQSTLIILAFEDYEPLLEGNTLSEAEKLVQQSKNAFSILHELGHAAAAHMQRTDPCSGCEPFYHNDAIAEMGYAQEHHTLGGTQGGVFCDRKKPWANWRCHFRGYEEIGAEKKFRYHGRYRQGAVAEYWPVSIAWIESIQQQKFWEAAALRLGANAFTPPRVWGKRYIRGATNSWNDEDEWQVLGPDYRKWITKAGKPLSDPEMPPVDAQEYEKWQAERQRRIRQEAVKVAVRRQEQEVEFLRQDRQRIRSWEERRRRNPVPLTSYGKGQGAEIALARRRVLLREAELKEMEAAIRAENENKVIPDEDIAREALVIDMLNEARIAANRDQQSIAYDILTEVIKITKSKLNQAQALVTLASLDRLGLSNRRRQVNDALKTFRELKALRDPSADWEKWIEEANQVLASLTTQKKEEARSELEEAQASVAQAYQAMAEEDLLKCARLCYRLVNSRFLAIKAHAHLICASLEATNDRGRHAAIALRRFKRLLIEAPDAGNWAARIEHAEGILKRFPIEPPHEFPDGPTEEEEQGRLDKATNDEVAAIKLYKKLTESKFRSIRAQARLFLAGLESAGDRDTRWRYAERALEAFEKLIRDDPDDKDIWTPVKERAQKVMQRLEDEAKQDREEKSTLAIKMGKETATT